VQAVLTALQRVETFPEIGKPITGGPGEYHRPEFKSWRGDKKFCSNACRQANYRKHR
jgi:hypothetical protein